MVIIDDDGGMLTIEVNHYGYLAREMAMIDLEYIRKQVNSNRSLRNEMLSDIGSRVYESAKTLLDVVEVVYKSGSDRYLVIPEVTKVSVDENGTSNVQISGRFSFPSDRLGTYSGVTYRINASYANRFGSTESYTIVYSIGPNSDGEYIGWTEEYPVTENGILGYSVNMPAPSQLAGKVSEVVLNRLNT